ncbi:MAG: sulfatase-like hydrolase/transferase [Opitutae bacterium]
MYQHFISFFLFSLSWTTALLAKPNMIVIMCDDLGYADVGFNGCKDIPTPHIDSIARNGIICTSGYVTYPVCGPSRAGFITARYPQRFGFERNPQYQPDDPGMGLTREEKTIAELIKPRGYHCGIIGKWHLGAHIPTSHPMKRGFDEFYGHLGGGHFYFPEKLTIRRSQDATDEMESYRTWLLKGYDPVPPRKYLTDDFSDEAVAFVERNRDWPFFLFLAYNAPHGPLEATPEYLNRFSHIDEPKRKMYAAMVSAVDDGVGRLLSELEKYKLLENTIVVFLSDNGGITTKSGSSNLPLRGNKGEVWEGGFRVPFAIQWQGVLPKGSVYEYPVSSLDIGTTIVSLSGAEMPQDKPLDGANLIPFLTGKDKSPPHPSIYLRKYDSDVFAVRNGNEKLVLSHKGASPQLFDLEEDISEGNDLAKQRPKRVEELEKLRRQWNDELIEPTFLGLIHRKGWGKKKKK